MFSRKQQLIQRTGKHGIGRYDFLKSLVKEFNTTKSKDAKEQVLANLANFAYDPVNYEYMKELRIIDVFLYALSEENVKLVRFAAAGICNICLEPECKDYIIQNQGIALVSSLLSSQDEETVLSSITTLIFLLNPKSKPLIITPSITNRINKLTKSDNKRISNLATLFINDHTDLQNTCDANSNK